MSSDQQSANAAKPPASSEVWVITPDANLGPLGRVREIWRYRRILSFFAWRAVRMLYANTKLGPAWLLLRPLTPVIVGTLIFDKVIQVPFTGVPYFLFLLVGSIVWGFFVDPLTRASRGLDVNRQLLTKLYLPRVILPAGQLAAGLVEPIVLIGVFAVTVWWYRYADGVWYGVEPSRLPMALLATALAIVFAFALSLWTSVWQARARDVRYMLAYILSFWFFLTPVIYPLSVMPPDRRWLALLNPMTGPVEAFRWSLLGIGSPDSLALATSAATIVAVLLAGFWFFTASESRTVDAL